MTHYKSIVKSRYLHKYLQAFGYNASIATNIANHTMNKKEFVKYKPPQSDKGTLEKLEGKGKQDKYEQAKVGAMSMDAKGMNQMSSSGKAAQEKRK